MKYLWIFYFTYVKEILYVLWHSNFYFRKDCVFNNNYSSSVWKTSYLDKSYQLLRQYLDVILKHFAARLWSLIARSCTANRWFIVLRYTTRKKRSIIRTLRLPFCNALSRVRCYRAKGFSDNGPLNMHDARTRVSIWQNFRFSQPLTYSR